MQLKQEFEFTKSKIFFCKKLHSVKRLLRDGMIHLRIIKISENSERMLCMLDLKKSETYLRDREAVINLTQTLVRIDSVYRDDGAGTEQKAAEYVAQYLRDIGIETYVEEVVPGRPNVIGIIEIGRAHV